MSATSRASRDMVIHHLVAIDAQLRRIRCLAGKIGDSAELRARIGPLLDETSKRSHRLLNWIAHHEGWQHDPGSPGGGEAPQIAKTGFAHPVALSCDDF